MSWTKSPQFSYVKARAAARNDENVDWPRTKFMNESFNAEVDGCESFVMRDGSVCEWKPGAYTVRGARKRQRARPADGWSFATGTRRDMPAVMMIRSGKGAGF